MAKNINTMNPIKALTIALACLSTAAMAQTDLVVGTATTYPLNIQNKNTPADIFLLQNARYNSGADLLQFETAHATFGHRGIRMNYSSGIHFYAANSATTVGATFTPTTRFFIGNNGNIGIGTTSPAEKLQILGGNILLGGTLTLDNAATPSIATGTGASELGRYLRVINTTALATPAGLKAGGIAIADDFNYAAPAKNDLVVKGRVGVGTVVPTASSHALSVLGTVGIGATIPASSTHTLAVGGTINSTGLYVNNQLFVSSQWTAVGNTIYYNVGNVGIGTPLTNNANGYLLAVNGKIGAKDVHVENSSTTWPDYVFEPEHTLPSLAEVEAFIKVNKHLQNVPSGKEIEEKGFDVTEMNAILLRKIEELTLYVIQQQKEIDALKGKSNTQK